MERATFQAYDKMMQNPGIWILRISLNKRYKQIESLINKKIILIRVLIAKAQSFNLLVSIPKYNPLKTEINNLMCKK
jgi:hypothetical protein